jgi:hypothetical protein
MVISRPVSPALLIRLCWKLPEGSLAVESGMIRTEMAMQKRSEMVAVYGTPCAIPPLNNTSKVRYGNIFMYIYVCMYDILLWWWRKMSGILNMNGRNKKRLQSEIMEWYLRMRRSRREDNLLINKSESVCVCLSVCLFVCIYMYVFREKLYILLVRASLLRFLIIATTIETETFLW